MPFNDGTNLNHISKYIVDINGGTPYSTIQSALNAANTAGVPALVYVRSGTYTENLTLYSNVWIEGDNENGVIINGTHTPPASGKINVRKVTLQSATHVFSSAVAGTTDFIVEDTTFTVTNGYVFNLLNWTGSIACFDIGSGGSTNNGIINNTGGAAIFLLNGTYGAGSVNTMILSGVCQFFNANIQCPITVSGTGTMIATGGCQFSQTVTYNAGTFGAIANSIMGATGPCLTVNTANPVELADVTMDTANNPAIAGTGAIDMGSITFFDNDTIAGTLTVNGKSLKTGDLTVSNRTPNGVPVYGTGGVLSEVGPLTNGQIVIGSTGATPVAATLTPGAGISIGNAAGAITITATAGGFAWVEVLGVAQAMAVDTGYIANNAGLVTLTLPATAAIGATVHIIGKGAGGWRIAQNAGQTIHYGNQSTTTGAGGRLDSTHQRDTIEMVCTTTNSDWTVMDGVGNITVT